MPHLDSLSLNLSYHLPEGAANSNTKLIVIKS